MIDEAIVQFDKTLRTLFAPARSVRPTPGADVPETHLGDRDRQHVAALMRVNHSGEICAQALYQGQSMSAGDLDVKRELARASDEETEHLAWTEQRISELGGRKSLLNPLWYGGSLALGLLAGRLGDRWNLGFLAETERQVEAHLSSHLERLPPEDRKSREILERMKADEAHHADVALALGAHELPAPFRGAMRLMARVMTATAYRI